MKIMKVRYYDQKENDILFGIKAYYFTSTCIISH